jgi:hypothetical protein
MNFISYSLVLGIFIIIQAFLLFFMPKSFWVRFNKLMTGSLFKSILFGGWSPFFDAVSGKRRTRISIGLMLLFLGALFVLMGIL